MSQGCRASVSALRPFCKFPNLCYQHVLLMTQRRAAAHLGIATAWHQGACPPSPIECRPMPRFAALAFAFRLWDAYSACSSPTCKSDSRCRRLKLTQVILRLCACLEVCCQARLGESNRGMQPIKFSPTLQNNRGTCYCADHVVAYCVLTGYDPCNILVQHNGRCVGLTIPDLVCSSFRIPQMSTTILSLVLVRPTYYVLYTGASQTRSGMPPHVNYP